jgi:hypothetical protein
MNEAAPAKRGEPRYPSAGGVVVMQHTGTFKPSGARPTASWPQPNAAKALCRCLVASGGNAGLANAYAAAAPLPLTCVGWVRVARLG